jgi:hypothetical protein
MAVSPVGNWSWLYDWNSDGSYSKAKLTLNADGTWSSSEGYTGNYVVIDGGFILNFNNSKTTYAGDIKSKAVVGVSTTFSGLNGSFVLLQEGIPAPFATTLKTNIDELIPHIATEKKRDASGKDV